MPNIESIRRTELIKFNQKISEVIGLLNDKNRWEEEPLDCIFCVDEEAASEDVLKKIVFSCVDACGNHLIESLDEAEYEELKELLDGDDPIQLTNISDLLSTGAAPKIESGVFDVGREAILFEEYLNCGY